MKLELDSRLRVFAALARQHSFSKAAQELSISQPAVSHHIADLENDLGVLLVNRGSKKVALTPAGEYLAQYVFRAEALLVQASLGLKAYTQATPYTLHLAASGTPGNYLLPSILTLYQQTYPEVTIDLSLGTSRVVIDTVRTHQAELGVVGGLASVSEVEVEAVYEDEIILIGSNDLAGLTLTPRKLRTFTWLTREPGSSTRQIVEAAWQDLGIVPQKQIVLPSWEAIKLAVASGQGIAACSRLVIGPELQSGLVSLLDAPAWKVRRTISLIKFAEVELSKEAGWFREMLIKQLRTT
jgi:LysR family transcriptional regulator, transcriptional activator of the cysJI operon